MKHGQLPPLHPDETTADPYLLNVTADMDTYFLLEAIRHADCPVCGGTGEVGAYACEGAA